MFGAELIASLAGLIIPPAFDFVKKKFLKKNQDSAEATLSTLSTTKPEVIPDFVKANTALLEAKVKFFNRDVIGIPSVWVINLRASIRPMFVIISLAARICGWIFGWNVDEQFRILMDVCISSWFGSRLI